MSIWIAAVSSLLTRFYIRLLGWSAFAGFPVLIFSWVANHFVAKRSFRVQKGYSTARDKRMSVLNELIGAIKFIKFFAWEPHWIRRVLDAREVEIQWLIKGAAADVCTVDSTTDDALSQRASTRSC